MRQAPVERDWSGFLGRPAVRVGPALIDMVTREKAILITGAGGSIGSRLARSMVEGSPRKLLLLDSSESALYAIYRELSQGSDARNTKIVPLICNITHRPWVAHLLQHHRPDLLVHTAAYKHVPLMEQNPFSAMHNNAVGTYRLIQAAIDNEIRQLLLISTDKAVDPTSVMGASKRIAELAVIANVSSGIQMNIVRLGNVLGSSGSVVPLFEEQSRQGLSLTVTDQNAERYFLTPQEADLGILQSATSLLNRKIFVPECGGPLRIVKLAEYIARRGKPSCREISPVKFIGLRPGDKLTETLISDTEAISPERFYELRVVASSAPATSDLPKAMKVLSKAIRRFDSVAMAKIVTELVPSYGASRENN